MFAGISTTAPLDFLVSHLDVQMTLYIISPSKKQQATIAHRQAQHQQCSRIKILCDAWKYISRSIREKWQGRYLGPEWHEREVSRIDGRHESPYPVDLRDISSEHREYIACYASVHADLHRPLERRGDALDEFLDDGRRHVSAYGLYPLDDLSNY